MTTIRLIAIAVLLLFCTGALAQRRGAAPAAKKLYCWNQDGHRTCGDTLPPGATDLARTEISASSGLHTGEIGRALTAEERAAAAAAAQQAEAEAAAEAARRRRDLAMVGSYATEDDLRRAYGERISLLDDALKASLLGEANLRRSLVSLLDQASGLELSGKPVPAATVANLRNQHAELLKQQRILAQQRADRASLDGELADAITRYRTLKHPEGVAPAATPTPAALPGG
ncbi:hypothetical protein [Cognatiluteimonas weifangensis]|uniref:DUF4124 domain-containing protein n=1 Tax=Cognatiluteimonas weifangensis TaxID=2303539 RepID=A0A372DHT3_9GAMM|nr:hypothetical protein [Luteimonas weifangensis]RFP59089.1 hypothetical protein D0Y53_11655 [Luteimonas weifangensis]